MEISLKWHHIYVAYLCLNARIWDAICLLHETTFSHEEDRRQTPVLGTGFEEYTAIVPELSIFWDMSPCTPQMKYCFEGTSICIRVHGDIFQKMITSIRFSRLNYSSSLPPINYFQVSFRFRNSVITIGTSQQILLLKNAIFWDVTPRGSCKNRCFGGTYRLHHQCLKNERGRKVSSN
jgi:hypothetical protein